jgi:hypothetical protein
VKIDLPLIKTTLSEENISELYKYTDAQEAFNDKFGQTLKEDNTMKEE